MALKPIQSNIIVQIGPTTELDTKITPAAPLAWRAQTGRLADCER